MLLRYVLRVLFNSGGKLGRKRFGVDIMTTNGVIIAALILDGHGDIFEINWNSGL